MEEKSFDGIGILKILGKSLATELLISFVRNVYLSFDFE